MAKRVVWTQSRARTGSLLVAAALVVVAACGRVALEGADETGDGGEGSGQPASGSGGKGPRGAVGTSEGGEPGEVMAGGRAPAPSKPKPPRGGSGTGGSAGSAGMGGSAPGCPAGQIVLQDECACPAYAPSYCAEASKCVDFDDDVEHCGSCEEQCGPTQACSAGACLAAPELVAEIANCGQLQLVQEGALLYLLASESGQLFYLNLAEAFHPIGLARYLAGANAFAVAGDQAYVAAGTSLKRVGIDVELTETITTEPAAIHDVAVADGQVYYATAKVVRRVAADATDGAGITVATAVDEGEPQGVAVSATHVFFASAAAYNLEAQALGAADHFKLGASQGSMIFGHRSVQTDGARVFWVNGGVQSVSLAEPEHLQSTAAPSRGTTVAYAIANSAAYLATAEGDLEKAALFAETSTWLARGLSQVSSLAVGPDDLWIAAGCQILRLDP